MENNSSLVVGKSYQLHQEERLVFEGTQVVDGNTLLYFSTNKPKGYYTRHEGYVRFGANMEGSIKQADHVFKMMEAARDGKQ